MGTLKKYDRTVHYEVSYIPIERENSIAELTAALAEFGSDGVWTLDGDYIVLTCEMSSMEVPA